MVMWWHMNEDSIGSKITRFVFWCGVMAIVFLWIGLLFAPAFLPELRKRIESKYEKFTHKDALIAEEMKMYTVGAWIICIIAWIITFLLCINDAR